VVPQDSQIFGGNFPKRKKSAAELCQILRIVTIYIVINSRIAAYALDNILPVLHCLLGEAFVSSFICLSRSESCALCVRGVHSANDHCVAVYG